MDSKVKQMYIAILVYKLEKDIDVLWDFLISAERQRKAREKRESEG
jgi:hypothetical protein